MNQIYKKAVAEAMESVEDVDDPELKKSGFEILLKKLIENSSETSQSKEGFSLPAGMSIASGYSNKTGLSEEEVKTLFEVNEDVVTLKVKPVGVSVPEQQQSLAHAILIGYKAALGKDSVPSSSMLAAAREWNLWNTNFSTNIQTPGYVQAKGVRKGATYSLKPGAVGKLKDSL